MSFIVRVRWAAKLDIAEAEDWYEAQVQGLGLEFRGAVEKAIDRIATNPFLYPELVLGNRRFVMRRFSYNIWYQVLDDSVLIVAVVHGKRGARALRGKLRRP